MQDVKLLDLSGTPRQPNGVPQTFIVQKLDAAAPVKLGRKRKLKLPPVPQAILDAMTDLERENFDFLIAAVEEEFGDQLTMLDKLWVRQAAIEHINLLRVQAEQLQSGKVISMARQHPGVQLRQWLDMLSVTRKQRGVKTEDKTTAEMEQALLGLSRAA